MGSTEIPIGERVRFYRTAQNKTQAVVAGLAGMNENYLGQIERGLRTPTIDKLHQLALLRAFTKRVGRMNLSLMVADRAVMAAEAADDPLRIAAAKWNLGQILLSQGEDEGAEDVALRSIEDLRRERLDRTPDQAALEGALWLVAAIASGRRHDHWTARERVKGPATEAAREAGEGNVFWTVFGPLNVGLHMVSVEMQAGEVSEALYVADHLNVNQSPSLERRMTFALEVARCYELRQEDAAVILHLMNAEAIGPEDLRYNTLARDLVRSLLKRARPTFQPQVQAMARRIGLLEPC